MATHLRVFAGPTACGRWYEGKKIILASALTRDLAEVTCPDCRVGGHAVRPCPVCHQELLGHSTVHGHCAEVL